MSSSTRRDFLKSTAAVTLAAPLLAHRPVFASSWEMVNIAAVGVSGKGESDIAETSVGNNVVAICDVDEARLEAAAARYPNAKKYTDWRKLLEQKDIDAVTVSTPDHMHASVSLAAMELGKHVYTQKPLTNTVAESRKMAESAAKHKVITQMGTQHHSSARLQNAVQLVQDGAIGKVREVHTWTDRPGNFWKQGLQRPTEADAVPTSLHWDLWLGVAAERPFKANLYHPFHWRGWWDFGTGALGDMGCHIMDPVATALDLKAPKFVSAEGPEPDAESGPLWCIVHYEFPGTKFTTDSLKLHWYEAGKQPPREIFLAPADWKGSDNGVLFLGEKGNLFVGFPEDPMLFPREKFADYKLPTHEEKNHYLQWTNAIRGEGETTCPFSYAGPLTETVLLGNVAYRAKAKIDWDSVNMQTRGNASANKFLARDYRQGW
jgi:predicted dehydrogenase